MVRRAVLMGHLGDVCMLMQASRSNPDAIELFTRPEFVHIASELGHFAQVAPISWLQREKTEVIDLHTTSCQDPEYRRAMRARGGPVAATHERLAWLGLSGRELPQRTYQSQSLSAYWKQLLGLARGFSHEVDPTQIRALCLANRSPCRTLLSLQSTTRHKSLSRQTAAAVAAALSKVASRRLTIVNGPGPPADGLEDFTTSTIRINSPEDFVQLARDHCCLVSVDSGLRHLAALLELPRIVAYGPTVPRICGSGFGELPVLPTTLCRSCGDPFSCVPSERPFECLGEAQDCSERIVGQWKTLHGSP